MKHANASMLKLCGREGNLFMFAYSAEADPIRWVSVYSTMLAMPCRQLRLRDQPRI